MILMAFNSLEDARDYAQQHRDVLCFSIERLSSSVRLRVTMNVGPLQTRSVAVLRLRDSTRLFDLEMIEGWEQAFVGLDGNPLDRLWVDGVAVYDPNINPGIAIEVSSEYHEYIETLKGELKCL